MSILLWTTGSCSTATNMCRGHCRLARVKWWSRWGSSWRRLACMMSCPSPKHGCLWSSLLCPTQTPRSDFTTVLTHCLALSMCFLAAAVRASGKNTLMVALECGCKCGAQHARAGDWWVQVDITVNNILAIVNTKLLRDYAAIDDRLLQLVFVVKLWAKRRQVNDSYRGTLSSYCYVLMCIHLLQQRSPPVLPCLQAMQPTHTRYPSCSPACHHLARASAGLH